MGSFPGQKPFKKFFSPREKNGPFFAQTSKKVFPNLAAEINLNWPLDRPEWDTFRKKGILNQIFQGTTGTNPNWNNLNLFQKDTKEKQ